MHLVRERRGQASSESPFYQAQHERKSTPTPSRPWSTSVQPFRFGHWRQSVSRRRRVGRFGTCGNQRTRGARPGGERGTDTRGAARTAPPRQIADSSRPGRRGAADAAARSSSAACADLRSAGRAADCPSSRAAAQRTDKRAIGVCPARAGNERIVRSEQPRSRTAEQPAERRRRLRSTATTAVPALRPS